jgi:thymidylate kinase
VSEGAVIDVPAVRVHTRQVQTLIAFTGPDGSGKSTQLKRLRETLRDRGYSVGVAHQYEPVASPMRALKNRMRGGALDPTPGRFSPAPRSGRRARAFATGWWWLVSGWWRATAHVFVLRRCDVILLDRCYIDEIVRVSWRFGHEQQSGWRLLRAAPRPDVVIALEANASDGWARKKRRNMSRADYAAKREVVAAVNRAACRWWPVTAIVVDGRTTEDVESEILRVIQPKLSVHD